MHSRLTDDHCSGLVRLVLDLVCLGLASDTAGLIRILARATLLARETDLGGLEGHTEHAVQTLVEGKAMVTKQGMHCFTH